MKSNLTLGQFIEFLVSCDGDWRVYFEFGGMIPTNFNSYRGFYDQLALGFKSQSYGEAPTVSSLLSEARSCVGKVFTGYKGGNYTMDLHTELWVDNPGSSTSTMLVGITSDRDLCQTYLQTEHLR